MATNTESKNIQTEKELLGKIADLTMALQKEVAELKEDTLVNASHIQIIKNSHKDKMNDLNTSVSDLNNATIEIVNGIEDEFSKTSGTNYTEFLKALLQEDFKALQNEAIEQSKREILAMNKGSKKKENAFMAFLSFISPFLSVFSFVLLLVICVKFKLFGMLFQ